MHVIIDGTVGWNQSLLEKPLLLDVVFTAAHLHRHAVFGETKNAGKHQQEHVLRADAGDVLFAGLKRTVVGKKKLGQFFGTQIFAHGMHLTGYYKQLVQFLQ